MTSFDWNIDDPSIIGTCSIDTTCTLWDLRRQTIITQIVAHDKEVYDVAFSTGVHVFATAGGDGSIRLFDSRDLSTSTILYENGSQVPFVRLAWNRIDTNLLATISMDCTKVTIVDTRFPCVALQELSGHRNPVNSIAWAPTSRYFCAELSDHMATAGDDGQVLIWDIKNPQYQASGDPSAIDPMLTYYAGEEITSILWPISNPEWILISFGNLVQLLKV